jgi:hypothetical protein
MFFRQKTAIDKVAVYSMYILETTSNWDCNPLNFPPTPVFICFKTVFFYFLKLLLSPHLHHLTFTGSIGYQTMARLKAYLIRFFSQSKSLTRCLSEKAG